MTPERYGSEYVEVPGYLFKGRDLMAGPEPSIAAFYRLAHALSFESQLTRLLKVSGLTDSGS
jgi:hypothetical protein